MVTTFINVKDVKAISDNPIGIDNAVEKALRWIKKDILRNA